MFPIPGLEGQGNMVRREDKRQIVESLEYQPVKLGICLEGNE